MPPKTTQDPAPIRPLDEHDRKVLKTMQRSIALTREYLHNCRECHIDVEAEARLNDEQGIIVDEILKRHFPERA